MTPLLVFRFCDNAFHFDLARSRLYESQHPIFVVYIYYIQHTHATIQGRFILKKSPTLIRVIRSLYCKDMTRRSNTKLYALRIHIISILHFTSWFHLFSGQRHQGCRALCTYNRCRAFMVDNRLLRRSSKIIANRKEKPLENLELCRTSREILRLTWSWSL